MTDYLRHVPNDSDSLRGLAVKYLGDHREWFSIAVLNNIPPENFGNLGIYPQLLIPVAVSADTPTTSPYRTDLATQDGGIVLGSSPGIKLVTGRDNYQAAILRALQTEKMTLLPHPTYGLDLDAYIGQVGTGFFTSLLAVDVERVIRMDDRTADVQNVAVSLIAGDRRFAIAADIVDVAGRDLQLSVERAY